MCKGEARDQSGYTFSTVRGRLERVSGIWLAALLVSDFCTQSSHDSPQSSVWFQPTQNRRRRPVFTLILHALRLPV